MTMHARTLTAAARTRDEYVDLVAPAPGLFRTMMRVGDVVHPGSVLGMFEVLGHSILILAPDVAGAIVELCDASLSRAPVDHGAVLVTLDPRASASAGAVTTTSATSHAGGLVFRAPTSGRFYGRSAPDKPAFVAVGDELAQGATVCLLEVMKTFHRVTYGGAGVPERARVKALLVADGADVTQGDALLALEPI